MRSITLASTLLLISLACQAEDDLDLFVTQADGSAGRLVISSTALTTEAAGTPAPSATSDIQREFETR